MHDYLKGSFGRFIFVLNCNRMTSFILNDEKVLNSYGFRVRNEGIDLKRFKKNPVILNDHWNDTASVLGKWDNIRIEGSKLLADPVFDMEDEAAQKIAGKVERGFLKGCSMGLSFDRAFLKAKPDGSYELETSELMEASLVAVPANASAIKLYAVNGQPMDDKDVRLSLQNIQTNNIETMEKYALSANALTALGLANADDANAVSTAVTALKADLDNAKAKLTALEAEAATKAKEQANALVDGAIAEGKLTADLKDSFVQMALGNYAMATKVIAAMPGKKSLAAQVGNSAPAEVKTEADFAKLSHEEQLAFKEEHPETYTKIFG